MSGVLRLSLLGSILMALQLLAASGLSAAEPVHVRVANHDDVTRLVFDWGTDVNYEAGLSEAFLVIDFGRPGAFDIQDLRERLPKRLAEAELDDNGHELRLRFRRPQKITHFALPGRVVFDLENAGHGIQTIAAMQDVSNADAGGWRSLHVKAPDPPRRRPKTLGGKAPGGSFLSWPQDLSVAAARKAPARVEVLPLQKPQPDKVSPVVHEPNAVEGFALRLAWEQRPPAAAFRFADSIWLLFDAPLPAGTAAAIERTTGRKGIRQIDSGPGTFLKITAGPGLAPRLQREDNGWHVDIRSRMPLPLLAIASSHSAVKEAPSTNEGARRFAVTEAGQAHWIEDPDSGERLIVVPTLMAGLGSILDSRLPQFAVLQSQQGLLLRPFDEGLSLAVTGYSVMVSHEKGLLTSPPQLRRPGFDSGEEVGRLFDLTAWRRGTVEDFTAARQELLASVVAAPEGEDVAARKALVRFLFAWGLLPEAEAQLWLLAKDHDTRTGGDEVWLMHAVAALQGDALARAAVLLSDPILSGSREAVLWQAAYAAAGCDWQAAAAGFAASDDLISDYAPRLANRLWRLAAEARLGIGDTGGASQYLMALNRAPQTRGEEAEATFLMAQRYLLDGEGARAEALWRALEDSGNPLVRARATRNLAEADYAAGRLEREDLLAALERLRFAWRGDAFELDVLLRLSDLYAETGRYRQSLEMLRQAASYFPEESRARQVAGRMRQIFQVVFLEDEGARVPPLAALALYEEFQELTPSGAEGDLILRRLADDLVEMDLLDQAAALLEELLRYRLTGGIRVVVGTRLAEIYLLDGAPAAALESLNISEAAQASPERLAERRLLRARALSGLSRHSDALGVIAQDDSRAALTLRAALYSRLADWPKAVRVYARLLPAVPSQTQRHGPPLAARAGVKADNRTLDPDLTAIVMKAAVAASLANDAVFLARLARDYGQAMTASPQAVPFQLLAGGIDADGTENPAGSLAVAGAAKRLLLGMREGL